MFLPRAEDKTAATRPVGVAGRHGVADGGRSLQKGPLAPPRRQARLLSRLRLWLR